MSEEDSSYYELSWACTSLNIGLATCAVDDVNGFLTILYIFTYKVGLLLGM